MSLSRLDTLTLAVAMSSRPALGARLVREAVASEPTAGLDAAWRTVALDPAALAPARALASLLLAQADEQGLHVLDWAHPQYPPLLHTLPDPPLALWVRGEPALLTRPSIALVGSRAARPAAVETARTMAGTLASLGIVVVSGLARGVDAAAHIGALDCGVSVAVLGTGIDGIYPAQHAPLADRLATTGALVSEFLPGTPPLAHHFPLRNRILSGLVRAVVVVEASERSGSLITARLAAEQGRDVMVVPGDVRGGANRGGHALLRDGARLVESAADVLEELGWTPETSPIPAVPLPPLVALLRQSGGQSIDDLVERTGRTAPELLRDLLDLELAGVVARDLSGRFLPVGGKW